MASVLKSGAATDAKENDDDMKGAARRVSGLAGFNLDDLADEGRSRLEQCRVQVRSMLDQAAKDAEQVHADAKANGYQEGLRAAAVDAEQKLKAEAETRAKDGLAVISRAVEKLHQTHEDWMNQYAAALTGIALAAAQRIVGKQLEREPELLVAWASEALASTRSATRLTLAVHPETLAELGESLDRALASPNLPEQTHVEPDETLSRGDVVVRQPGGEIQAGLHAQLDRLSELLS